MIGYDNIFQHLDSIKTVDRRYHTGEEPVLVECSDRNAYVCKYSRYSGSASKLVCELVGSMLARTWALNTPDLAIISVLPQHTPSDISASYFQLPSFGSKLMRNVIDITPTTISQLPQSERLCKQLLRIALFDMWVANEDRNANNANLMYDVLSDNLIAIDFGCIFNTATLDYPLSQLTETDSILTSDLFRHISANISKQRIAQMVEVLTKVDFSSCVHNCKTDIECLTDWTISSEETQIIPNGWIQNKDILASKLSELLSDDWLANVESNFMEIIKQL